MREYFVKIFAEKSGKKCMSILYQKILTEQEVKFQKKWGKCMSILYQKIFYELFNGKKCVSILYQKILGRNRCMKCICIYFLSVQILSEISGKKYVCIFTNHKTN